MREKEGGMKLGTGMNAFELEEANVMKLLRSELARGVEVETSFIIGSTIRKSRRRDRVTSSGHVLDGRRRRRRRRGKRMRRRRRRQKRKESSESRRRHSHTKEDGREGEEKRYLGIELVVEHLEGVHSRLNGLLAFFLQSLLRLRREGDIILHSLEDMKIK